MKVNYSQTTYTEVKDARKDALKNSHSLKAIVEMGVHYLKRMPFLLIWLLFVDLLLKTAINPIYGFIMSLMKYSDKKYMNDITIGVRMGISTLLTLSVIAILALVVYEMLFKLVRTVFPQKTPLSDRENLNIKFWRKTEEIENALRVMDELSKMSKEDLAYSEVILDGESVVLMLKDSVHGLTIREQYKLKNENMLDVLKRTGILDFSFVDSEWKSLKEEHLIA